ncbi:succinyldiaminopimelate transaminase [Sulfuriflexus mobilis]|uniref:succinyldiaminopimelate transaminase n=1 Tax=Sulfuriflexus mobilis TaxID=1811807 RepID=UPI000F8221E8|nr:succinyldiaminopimelate transaminase [Sulfuriflexus mobilis]
MNPNLDRLQPYPFEKLATLKAGVTPATDKAHIALSIGEPKHSTPSFISEAIISHLHTLANYPLTRGSDELREAIVGWLNRRFELADGLLDAARHVLPVNGTREALFAFAQAVVTPGESVRVMMPNPFYQIYEGAALLAGATPYFLNTTVETNFLPDFDAVSEADWDDCQLLYLCSPGNPTGAVADVATLARLLELADKHDFIIASDECYAEIYFDEAQPPLGLLQVAAQLGRADFSRCIVFHSLSKRSNAPGLRSGFVAGDEQIIQQFLKYRTYHGCAMPPATQAASIAAWDDEAHVKHNRALYREKFAAVLEILSPVLDVTMPDAAFYLWARTPDSHSDTEFTRGLFETQNVTVLPGSFLSRDTETGNPGAGYVRMALVAPLDECLDAAKRIRSYIESCLAVIPARF